MLSLAAVPMAALLALASPPSDRPDSFPDSSPPDLLLLRERMAARDWGTAESLAVRLLGEIDATVAAGPGRGTHAPDTLSPDPDSLRTAEVIEALLDVRFARGRAADPATPALVRRAIGIRERHNGPESPAVGTVLRNVSRILYSAGDMAGARPLAERAVRIHESSLSASDPELVESLDNMAFFHGAGGELDSALAMYRRVLAIRRAALDPESLPVAATLNRIGFTLAAMGKYEPAIAPMEEALRIRQARLPAGDPAIAASLNDLASPYFYLANYARAESLLTVALRMRETALGPEHPMLAKTLDLLAIVYHQTGRPEEARRLWVRSLAIREKSQGPTHRDVATVLTNLMGAMEDLGAYEDGAALGERALAIQEATLGPDHPLLASILNNLALVYVDLGDLERARRYLDRSVEIQTAALGPAHIELTHALHTLGSLLADEGDIEAGRALLERAQAIRESTLVAHHPTLAIGLEALARLALREGRTSEAREGFERALGILVRNFGPDDLRCSSPLSGLAEIAASNGDLARAETLLVRALAIRRSHLGEEHPFVAETMVALGRIDASAGRTDEAFDRALWAEDVSRDNLRLLLRSSPEMVALRASAKRPSGLDLALSLVEAERGASPERTRRVFDTLIRSRTLVLDEMAERRRALETAAFGGTEADSLLASWIVACRRESRLVLQEENEPGEGYGSRIEGARRRVEEAERALARASATIRGSLATASIGLDEVLRALPPDAALVSYATWNPEGTASRRARTAGDVRTTGDARSYGAFVVSARKGDDPDGPREVWFVPLGDAADIEGAVDRWREEARHGSIPGRPAVAAEESYRAIAATLRRAVWDPVSPHIGGAGLVLVVPEGALGLVNFAALPVDGGGYLIEQDPLFHTLGSERDLVSGEDAPDAGRTAVEPILALGDPDFDAPCTELRGTVAPASGPPARRSETLAAAMRGHASRCDLFRSTTFHALPGSAEEVREIAAASGEDARILTGAAANEETFRLLASGRRIVHLATHGFFLGEECRTLASQEKRSRGITGLVPSGAAHPREEPARPNGASDAMAPRFDNPLLLSGLALAGANMRATAGPDDEDGILTAEEIGSLDLDGTEWAVLSACDSGVGTIHSAEGIIGLQRAFRIAGARTVVMSLWAVDDAATRQYMSALYDGRFRRSLGSAECVREASRRLLNESRASGAGGHPLRWGSFIAIGDWR